jgi:hypothetical protein
VVLSGRDIYIELTRGMHRDRELLLHSHIKAQSDSLSLTLEVSLVELDLALILKGSEFAIEEFRTADSWDWIKNNY